MRVDLIGTKNGLAEPAIDGLERSRGVDTRPHPRSLNSRLTRGQVDSTTKFPFHSNHTDWKQWVFSKGSSPSAAQGTKNPTESGKGPAIMIMVLIIRIAFSIGDTNASASLCPYRRRLPLRFNPHRSNNSINLGQSPPRRLCSPSTRMILRLLFLDSYALRRRISRSCQKPTTMYCLPYVCVDKASLLSS